MTIGYGILKDAAKVSITYLKRLRHFCRLWRYKRKSARPPITHEEAMEIAYITLAGKIIKAIPYQNMESKTIYIAVSYKPNQEDYATRIVILEQVGDSYRIQWSMDYHTSCVDFEVEDIDDDGTQELLMRSLETGTGSSTAFLTVYSQRRNASFTISETTDRQNLAGPIIPQIEFNPEPPADFKNALEQCALKRGFLTSRPQINWNDIRYAIERWHRDNGPSPNGKINATFYDVHPSGSSNDVLSNGQPVIKDLPFVSSAIASYDDGKIVWMSYFKNPLVGYIKDLSKWFIAYSPSIFYEWACSLAHDGKRLWFGIHSLGVIYSFQYETMQLYRHRSICGVKFKTDSMVSYKNGQLCVNDDISFTKDELEKAIKELEQAKRSGEL